MAASAAVTFFWQCERKEKVTLDAGRTVAEFKRDVAAQLEEDYKQPDKDLDCSDVKLYFNGAELTDDRRTLQEVGISAGSVVSALSVAVAEAVGERKKIRSTREVFEALRLAGKSDAKVEEAALKKAEPFDLCCSTFDLGELGAGWPILFQFICLLIMLLLGLFLIHIPTTVIYGMGENIDLWPVDPENVTMSSAMLTAGNLGPEGSSTLVIGWVSLIGGIFTLVAATMMSRKIGVTKKAIDIVEVDATDFGLFVENLPTDVVDEKDVKDWMEENLRENQSTQIVKVVIGYDMAEYMRLRKELMDLRKQVAECTDPREKASLTEKYKESNKTMTDEPLFHQAVGGSGSAVVVVRYQTEHREALGEWNSLRERLARVSSCLGGIPSLSLKPKFHHKGEEVMLTITRADQPSDIIWENLSVPCEVKCKARLRVYGLLFCVFLVAFVAILGGRLLQNKFERASWAIIIAGLAIGISTVVVFMFSKNLIDSERHETKTRRDISLMLSFTTMYAMNYNLALLFANIPNLFGNPDGIWYEAKGLLSTIFMLQIGTAFIYPLFYATGCKQCFGSCIRSCLGLFASDGVQSQAQLNKQYAPPEIDTARVYAQILKVYYLGLFYLPVMPLGGLVCGIGLIAYYWSLKYYLLRKCARPYRQSPQLGYVAVKCVFFGTALYGFSQWYFLSFSLQGEGEFWSETVMWALMGASLIMIVLPRQIYQYLLCTCLCFPSSDEDIDGEIDYYDVQKAWAKHQKYHTANDVYLWMENVYAAKKKQYKEKYTPPWELKTGNLPKPGVLAEPEAPEDAAGPMPGTLSIRPGAKTGLDTDAGSPLEDDEDIDAPAETAALASADPAELALEEMKYKLDLAALGALPTGEGDSGSEAAVSESGDESADEEAPPASGGLRPGMFAVINGLESSSGTKYNGTTCTVISMDDATGKWRCELEDGEKANLPESKLTPEAAALSPGTVVLLDGLTNEQYNGTEATIVNFDLKKKGYNVTLFTGVKACVKPWNVTPV